jgi:hypothetical protein
MAAQGRDTKNRPTEDEGKYFSLIGTPRSLGAFRPAARRRCCGGARAHGRVGQAEEEEDEAEGRGANGYDATTAGSNKLMFGSKKWTSTDQVRGHEPVGTAG